MVSSVGPLYQDISSDTFEVVIKFSPVSPLHGTYVTSDSYQRAQFSIKKNTSSLGIQVHVYIHMHTTIHMHSTLCSTFKETEEETPHTEEP